MTYVKTINHPNANLTLGYWNIRGLAQPIRLLLVAAGQSFSEVRLGVDENDIAMSESQELKQWHKWRDSLLMSFPNLPYLIDESCQPAKYLSQSNSILRYLGARFGFCGASNDEALEIDILQEQAYDFRNKIVDTAYSLGDSYPEQFNQFKALYLPKYLNSFEHYLVHSSKGEWFVGDRLSIADFVIYELCWQMTKMVPDSITEENRPNIYAFLRRFEAIPRIAEYLESQHYIDRPINSPWASFC